MHGYFIHIITDIANFVTDRMRHRRS